MTEYRNEEIYTQAGFSKADMLVGMHGDGDALVNNQINEAYQRLQNCDENDLEVALDDMSEAVQMHQELCAKPEQGTVQDFSNNYLDSEIRVTSDKFIVAKNTEHCITEKVGEVIFCDGLINRFYAELKEYGDEEYYTVIDLMNCWKIAEKNL